MEGSSKSLAKTEDFLFRSQPGGSGRALRCCGLGCREVLAKKAIGLDNTLGEAHAVLGNVNRLYHWDWAGAEEEYKLAMELDPSSYEAPYGYAYLMTSLGRHDEAIAMSKRAQQLDPMNLRTRTGLASQFYHAGRYDEAIEQCQITLDTSPNFIQAYIRLYTSYEAKGLWEEAAK